MVSNETAHSQGNIYAVLSSDWSDLDVTCKTRVSEPLERITTEVSNRIY